MNKNGEKLDKYCLVSSGGTPSKKNLSYYENGSILWATIADMEKSDGIVLDTKLKITEKGLSSIGNRIFPKDTLFLAMYGSVGKVAIAGKEMAVNQAILGIQPKNENEIFIPYLKYWLMHNKPKIVNKARGGILKNLSAKIVKNIKIELPSYSEQKKIANLLTQVETLIAKREESIELLDELLRSSFLDMFGTDINNTQKHPVVSLSEVSNKITDGTHQSPKFQDSGIPFLLVSNIKNNEITYTTQKYISDEEYEKLSKRTPIEIGNILLTTVGSYGNPAIIKSTKKFAFQRHIAFIQPNHEIVNYYYLFAMLKSPIVKNQIEKKVKGVAQKTLNLRDLKAIKIWLPERALQEKFATIVKQVESTKEQYQKSLDELRDLFGSLSQRAFRGELRILRENPLKDRKFGERNRVIETNRVSPSVAKMKCSAGSGLAENNSIQNKDLAVKLSKVGIDTSALGIGSKLAENMCKAEGIVNIDASLVGKEYNALHETLSSFGRAKMTDILPSISESLAPSFMTNEQFSKNLFDNALGLDKYSKAITSNYFETWRKEEEDRLSNLIARPTLGLYSSELWSNKISDAIGSSALSNLESVYGVNSAIETMNMWKHENERLQVLQISDYVKAEQEKFNQLAGLGKYDEKIHDFTQKYKLLFEASTSASDLIKDYESLQTYNSSIESLGAEALNKALGVEQSYKSALERAEAMNPLSEWGEYYESLLNQYSQKIERTKKIIESIPNLSHLKRNDLFKKIRLSHNYDDIKKLVYKLLDKSKLEQQFDEDEKKVILKKVEQ